MLIIKIIDLFRLCGLLPHFRPCDNTLGNSSNFQIVACICINFKIEKKII